MLEDKRPNVTTYLDIEVRNPNGLISKKNLLVINVVYGIVIKYEQRFTT